jgi:hypothetical protein
MAGFYLATHSSWLFVGRRRRINNKAIYLQCLSTHTYFNVSILILTIVYQFSVILTKIYITIHFWH